VGRRIREAELQKIPRVVVWGDKESQDSLAVRERRGAQKSQSYRESLHLSSFDTDIDAHPSSSTAGATPTTDYCQRKYMYGKDLQSSSIRPPAEHVRSAGNPCHLTRTWTAQAANW
jgi:hypothetical protein